MVDTTARLRIGKMTFETMVDMDSAMKLKKGEKVDINKVIKDNEIWTNLKQGMRPGRDELDNAFGTTEFSAIVERIVKKGEIEVSQEFRDEEIELRKKQISNRLTDRLKI